MRGRASRLASVRLDSETMMRLSTIAAAAALTLSLQGCGGGWWPFGRSSAPAAERLPPGATEYTCAEGKRLLVRFSEGGKSAWVIYPDREFRLDRSGISERYTNGLTTLSLQGDSAQLDSEGARQFTDCKRKPSS